MMGARGAVFATPPPVIARPSEEPAARSTSDIVRELHAKSGLTWEQLGRLIGVSRRAVHLWAAGGRINARHLELVMQLHDIVDGLPATEAAERRMLIFSPRHAQPSIFDAFLRQRASEEGVVSGTPFYPGRSRGGRHNEDGSD
jgi:DNA-binding XRE family transcriptional regulator